MTLHAGSGAGRERLLLLQSWDTTECSQLDTQHHKSPRRCRSRVEHQEQQTVAPQRIRSILREPQPRPFSLLTTTITPTHIKTPRSRGYNNSSHRSRNRSSTKSITKGHNDRRSVNASISGEKEPWRLSSYRQPHRSEIKTTPTPQPRPSSRVRKRRKLPKRHPRCTISAIQQITHDLETIRPNFNDTSNSNAAPAFAANDADERESPESGPFLRISELCSETEDCIPTHMTPPIPPRHFPPAAQPAPATATAATSSNITTLPLNSDSTKKPKPLQRRSTSRLSMSKRIEKTKSAESGTKTMSKEKPRHSSRISVKMDSSKLPKEMLEDSIGEIPGGSSSEETLIEETNPLGAMMPTEKEDGPSEKELIIAANRGSLVESKTHKATQIMLQSKIVKRETKKRRRTRGRRSTRSRKRGRRRHRGDDSDTSKERSRCNKRQKRRDDEADSIEFSKPQFARKLAADVDNWGDGKKRKTRTSRGRSPSPTGNSKCALADIFTNADARRARELNWKSSPVIVFSSNLPKFNSIRSPCRRAAKSIYGRKIWQCPVECCVDTNNSANDGSAIRRRPGTPAPTSMLQRNRRGEGGRGGGCKTKSIASGFDEEKMSSRTRPVVSMTGDHLSCGAPRPRSVNSTPSQVSLLSDATDVTWYPHPSIEYHNSPNRQNSNQPQWNELYRKTTKAGQISPDSPKSTAAVKVQNALQQPPLPSPAQPFNSKREQQGRDSIKPLKSKNLSSLKGRLKKYSRLGANNSVEKLMSNLRDKYSFNLPDYVSHLREARGGKNNANTRRNHGEGLISEARWGQWNDQDSNEFEEFTLFLAINTTDIDDFVIPFRVSNARHKLLAKAFQLYAVMQQKENEKKSRKALQRKTQQLGNLENATADSEGDKPGRESEEADLPSTEDQRKRPASILTIDTQQNRHNSQEATFDSQAMTRQWFDMCQIPPDHAVRKMLRYTPSLQDRRIFAIENEFEGRILLMEDQVVFLRGLPCFRMHILAPDLQRIRLALIRLREGMPSLYTRLLFVQRLPRVNSAMGDNALTVPTFGNFTICTKRDCGVRTGSRIGLVHTPLTADPRNRRSAATSCMDGGLDYELKYGLPDQRHEASIRLAQARANIFHGMR